MSIEILLYILLCLLAFISGVLLCMASTRATEEDLKREITHLEGKLKESKGSK